MSQQASQILLVGNNLKILDGLAAVLQNDSIVLRFARTAEQAMQFILDRPADLVLVDLQTENPEGLDLLRQLKEQPPRLAALTIGLTGADDSAAKLHSLEFGMFDGLPIPTPPEVCRARLLAALQTKNRLDQLLRQNGELMKARTSAEAAA